MNIPVLWDWRVGIPQNQFRIDKIKQIIQFWQELKIGKYINIS